MQHNPAAGALFSAAAGSHLCVTPLGTPTLTYKPSTHVYPPPTPCTWPTSVQEVRDRQQRMKAGVAPEGEADAAKPGAAAPEAAKEGSGKELVSSKA
jgi:hypothetical protein